MFKRLLKKKKDEEVVVSNGEYTSSSASIFTVDSGGLEESVPLENTTPDGSTGERVPKSFTSNNISTLVENDFIIPQIIPDEVEVVDDVLKRYGFGERIFGLQNFGYTCYCNSILQALYNIDCFRDGVICERVLGEMRGDLSVEESYSFKPEELDLRMDNKHYTYQNAHPADLQKIVTNEELNCESEYVALEKEKHVQSHKEKSRQHKTVILGRHIKNINDEFFVPNDNECMSSELGTHSPKVTNSSYLQKLLRSNKESKNSNKNRNEDRSVSITPSNNALTLENHCETKQNAVLDQDYSSETELSKSTEQKKEISYRTGPVIELQKDRENKDHTLFSCLREIYIEIAGNKSLTGVISPAGFIEIVKRDNVLFDTFRHQDAHEFFNFLINNLSDFLDTSMVVNQQPLINFVSGAFKGTLLNRTRCYTCDSVTERDEAFLDFPVEFRGNHKVDIQKLLDDYCEREILCSSNKFHCETCNEYQEAERLRGLKELPSTLVIHLKRFQYNEAKQNNIKLFNKVIYPFILNVTPTFNKSASKKYELSSIVVHIGASPQTGHYVTICKNKTFGWLIYDDETVQAVSHKLVNKILHNERNLASAYLLFYQEITEETLVSFEDSHFDQKVSQLLHDDETLRIQTKWFEDNKHSTKFYGEIRDISTSIKNQYQSFFNLSKKKKDIIK